jgi:XTP/dITP diphosphohydrolase
MNDVKVAFEKLVSIMLELRQKCPWDQKQTNESLRYLTLEECYELSDAIIENDSEGIKEELGDVILHVIFYSIIADEKNQFNLSEVLNTQRKKLINRHPHIYSNVKVKDERDVKRNWELLKLKEKHKKSILSGVPQSLPSMLKSYRIQEKVKGIGFDFPDNNLAFEKIVEEIKEFKDEISNNNHEKAEQELGDIFFALIGYAQMNGINSMNALEKTNQKFINRFSKVEKIISKTNKHLSNYSKEELSKFWNQVKSDDL